MNEHISILALVKLCVLAQCNCFGRAWTNPRCLLCCILRDMCIPPEKEVKSFIFLSRIAVIPTVQGQQDSSVNRTSPKTVEQQEKTVSANSVQNGEQTYRRALREDKSEIAERERNQSMQ